MWIIAFTLGLFGSLHCLGMCGPLAIAFCSREGASKSEQVQSAISYNLGRTVTYSLLGFLFGTLGSFLFVVDVQKWVSIALGLLLVISFIFTIDLEQYINGRSILKNYFFKVKNFISSIMEKSQSYHPFQLGMANGLLPCGLVYLALAGALATGDIKGGMLFMALFGLGTIPMLFALTTGFGFFTPVIKKKFRSVLPYVTLCFGVFLIYRGVAVNMPTELNFWEALKNPILCH